MYPQTRKRSVRAMKKGNRRECPSPQTLPFLESRGHEASHEDLAKSN